MISSLPSLECIRCLAWPFISHFPPNHLQSPLPPRHAHPILLRDAGLKLHDQAVIRYLQHKRWALESEERASGAWKAHRQNYYSPHWCRGSHSLDRVSYSIRIASYADDILQAKRIFYRTATILMVPQLSCPRNDLHPQDVLQSHAPPWPDSQRYASGSARNNHEFEPGETWEAGMNHIHSVLPRL